MYLVNYFVYKNQCIHYVQYPVLYITPHYTFYSINKCHQFLQYFIVSTVNSWSHKYLKLQSLCSSLHYSILCLNWNFLNHWWRGKKKATWVWNIVHCRKASKKNTIHYGRDYLPSNIYVKGKPDKVRKKFLQTLTFVFA